ncbi:hypothetical protein H4R20_005505 [Coemansia guatemalensis]|uniref:FAS1 domain-containing protein n=1 Tax=Coemansia guatemalensis TaxID=2761395 RepID=A0A9W8HPN8_9FUNG|nr:hypothetical protein H4R20_005505 [Coemansia guatemalensis]
MKIVTTLQIAALALATQVAQAQFQINPGTYDASELYDIISGNYNSNAAIWQDQLDSAKASLPGAYSVLTSIYNTDNVPETFDAEFVSNLAEEMIKIGHTTVVDPLVNSNTLVFSTQPTEETSAISEISTEDSATSESDVSEESTSGQEDSSEDHSSNEDVFTLSKGDSDSDDDSDDNNDDDTSGASPNTQTGIILRCLGVAVAVSGILSYI